ncbi:MAG: hypothetical protein Q8K75_10060 [Chlamydiales bacterium]|nr:hypothetical protein [Chlamydiales bacterium]
MEATKNNASAIFPEAYSSSADLLKTFDTWHKEGGAKFLLSHTIGPIALIATEALDILVHALAAVVKGIVWVPTTIVWLATACTQDPAPGANLPAILGHVGRALGNVVALPFVVATSFASAQTALGILDAFQLAPGASGEEAPVGFGAGFWAEKGVTAKAKFLWNHKMDSLFAAGGVAKSASIAVKDKALEHKGKIAIAVPTLAATAHQVWQEVTSKDGSLVKQYAIIGLCKLNSYVSYIPCPGKVDVIPSRPGLFGWNTGLGL